MGKDNTQRELKKRAKQIATLCQKAIKKDITFTQQGVIEQTNLVIR